MGDVALVGGDVGGEHGIEVVADGQNLFALGDVPHGGEAEVGAATAADDEEFAVGAEVDAVRVAFGIGNDAGDFEGVGIIKEHLALAADGDERRPRADGDGGGNAGAFGALIGIERKHFDGHWRGAFGAFAEGIGIEREIDLGFGGHHGFGSAVLEQAADDPRLEGGNLRIGEFALGRHVGFLGMGDELIKKAVIQIAASDDFAGHQRVVGGQVEVGLHLVRIVALEAVVAEDGQDVVLVSDFVRGESRTGSNEADGEGDSFQVPSIHRFKSSPLVVCPRGGRQD